MMTSATHSPTAAQSKDKSKTKDSAVTKQLTKTKMCAFYLRGKCASQTCRYAHSFSELKAAPNLQKTKLCKLHIQGECRDENCSFAHGEGDLRVTEGIYKTQMCNFWERGYCKKGDRCNHAHGPNDLRTHSSATSSPTSENAPIDALPKGLEGQTPMRERRNQLVLSEILDNARNLTPQPPTPMKAEMQPHLAEPIKSVTEILSQAFSPAPVPASPFHPGLLGHALAMSTPSPGLFGEQRKLWALEPVDVLVGPERRQPLPLSTAVPTVPPHPYAGVYPAPEPTIAAIIPTVSTPSHLLQAHEGSPNPRGSMEDSLEVPTDNIPQTADMWENSSFLNSMSTEDPDLKVRLASLDAVVRDLSADIESMATRTSRSRQSFHI
mmetsp:Transcript_2190/g.5574  ORF Transcript_2190/g.5574 Transcript_2190/m.5574 type:complete len:380 (-) Transcript_2190:123-1262(-)